MGCFDVVCALTNVPIHTGEQCHLVILKKDLDWGDSVVWLAHYQGQYSVEAVFHGEYDDYGSIEPNREITDKESELLENFREDDRLHFFLSDTAWKWTQEKFKDFVPHFIKERREMRKLFTNHGEQAPGFLNGDEAKEEEQIAIARVMAAFSYACKHPLSGLGCYHQYGGEEIEHIKEHLELVQKRLNEVEQYYKQFEEDEEA